MANKLIRFGCIVGVLVVSSPVAEIALGPSETPAPAARTEIVRLVRLADIDLPGPVEQLPILDATRFPAVITAYSSSPDETDDDPFITASGRRVFDGLVACPRRYAFGTKFKINGRTYTCFDRLNQRFDDRFDIWMVSKHEALRFGRRRLLVQVVG